MLASTTRSLVAAALTLALTSRGAFGQLFSTPKYPVGPAPYSITAGDLNGDGKPDLATSNYNSNTVSVLLSTSANPTGTGGYGPAASYVVGNGPYMTAAADVDNDGKIDLVTACYTGDLVAILKGNGQGSFGPVIALFPGNGPACVAVTDFTGDGWKDVASANFDDSTVGLVKANGAGGYLNVVTSSTGTTPNHITAVDLNGDAKPDAVTANYGYQTISVLLNNGAGGLGLWTGYFTGNAPFSMATGDVDADGDLDLAVSAAVSNEVRIHKNDGTGNPIQHQSFPLILPTGLAFADVHGDGKPDLLVGVQGSAPLWMGEIYVYNGNGNGVGGVGQQLIGGTQTLDVVALDLDLDGDVDVASCNAASNDVQVYGNLGGGVLTMPPAKTKYSPFYFYPDDMAAGDLNDDGQLDLVVSSDFAHSRFSTLRGHGDGLFDEPLYVEVFSEQRGLAVGDLTGNRTLDVAVSVSQTNSVVTKLGDGAGGFGSTFTYSGGAAASGRMAIGDLSSDGKPDLLVAHNTTPGLSIHWGNGIGGFFDPPATISATLPSVDVRIEDMDGNGYNDLVTSTGTKLQMWLGVAPSNFSPPASSQTMPLTGRMAIGDVTGDGRLDAVAASSNGNVYVVPGLENFYWSAPYAVAVTDSGELIPKLADLDADGKLDLIVGNSASGQYPIGLHVLLGNGFGGFGPATRFRFQNSPQAMSIADLDQDGRPDVVMACQNALANIWTEIIVMKNVLATPAGVAPFGAGTPGAYGRLGMNASSAAKVGSSSFALECTNAPRTALGIGLITNVANVAGADTFGLGLAMHVDLLASTLVVSLDVKSEVEGIGRVLVPIPNNPALAGATLAAQTIWVEKGASGQLTSDGLLGLVSSKGMTFTIVP